MSEKMNVLQILDEAIEGIGGPTDLGLSKARAAVAELIKASKELRRECLKSVEYSDWPELQKCVKKIDKALAKAEASDD